jgi:surface antigen
VTGKLHKKLFVRSLAAAAVLATGGIVATPAEAATTNIPIAGVVYCAPGLTPYPVKGIWVESSNGGSGWASWTALPDTSFAYYSYAIPSSAQATNVTLKVGCGGSTSSWTNTDVARAVTVHTMAPMSGHTYPTWLNVDCAGSSCFYPGVPTNWASRPASLYGNPGAAGNCTYGAALRWKDLLDVWPNWGGNAIDWGKNAKAAGWYTYKDYPRLGSIVSMPSADVNGHVIFVTGLRVVNGSIQMQGYDMNSSGLGNGNERWDYWFSTYWNGAKMTSIVPPYIPEGDTNADGLINLLDFSYLSAHYNSTNPNDWRADFNDDGAVNLLDYSLLSNWVQS